MPCHMPLSAQVHVFESNGASLGVRFMHHDALSADCGDALLAHGSRVVKREYVDWYRSNEELVRSRVSTQGSECITGV